MGHAAVIVVEAGEAGVFESTALRGAGRMEYPGGEVQLVGEGEVVVTCRQVPDPVDDAVAAGASGSVSLAGVQRLVQVGWRELGGKRVQNALRGWGISVLAQAPAKRGERYRGGGGGAGSESGRRPVDGQVVVGAEPAGAELDGGDAAPRPAAT